MAQCAGFKQKHALLKLGLPLRGILTLFLLFVKSIHGVSSSELSTGAVLFNSHGFPSVVSLPSSSCSSSPSMEFHLLNSPQSGPLQIGHPVPLRLIFRLVGAVLCVISIRERHGTTRRTVWVHGYQQVG